MRELCGRSPPGLPSRRQGYHPRPVARHCGLRLRQCLLANDGREGLEAFRKSRPPLIVTELTTPGIKGIELLQQIRQEDPDVAVIALGLVDMKTRIACLKLGAYAHFWRPGLMDELLIAAERAIKRRQLLIDRRRRGAA